jgi:hypothetical protein
LVGEAGGEETDIVEGGSIVAEGLNLVRQAVQVRVSMLLDGPAEQRHARFEAGVAVFDEPVGE